MILLDRAVALLGRIRRFVRRDIAREHREAGQCIFHEEDYWCDRPAVGDFCWEHQPAQDVPEGPRDEYDDEDEPRTFWGPR